MTLSTQLQTLETSGLIQLVQEQPELEYLFRHALMQDATYESLLLSDRKQMHGTVAQVLEQLFDGQLDEVAAVLAHHWQLAGKPGKALHYLVQAGDVAAAAYANDEAAGYYGRSLTLAQQTQTDSHTLVYLCTVLGRVLEIQGNYHEALTHYQSMSQLAEQIADRKLALAALMGRTKLHVTATPVHDLGLGEPLAQQAIALAQELDDEPAQTRLLWNMIFIYRYSGRLEQAITTGEQALVLAHNQKTIETEAYICNDLAFCYYSYGRYQDGLHMAEKARVLWEQLHNLPMLIDSLAQVSIAHYYLGNYAQSVSASDEGFQLGQAIGNPQAQAYVRVQAGLANWKLGWVGAVLDGYRTVIQLAEQADFVPVLIFAHANLALVLIGVGALAEAFTEAQIAQTLAQNHFPIFLPYAQTMVALAQIKQEELIAAEATITQMKAGAPYKEFPRVHPLTDFVEAMWLVGNGRYPQAMAVIQTNQQTLRGGEAIGLHPDYLLLKAQILRAINQPDAARESLQTAHALAQAHNNRQLLWQVLAEEAVLAEAVGELDNAQSLRREARQILTDIMADVPDVYRDSFKGMAEVTAVLQTP